MTRSPRLGLFLLLALFVAAYWIPLKSMAHIWVSNEDYSYGPFIPLISAYLLWEKRLLVDSLNFRTSWRVLPLLAAAVGLSLYGILGSSGNISMPAVPILLILFTAFIFGIPAMKKLILPLAFLIFMVPLPAVVERTIGVFLKSVATKLGGWVIGICNIPVNVSGNIIDLGVTQLQVVDACNGMRFIFPLLALGVLYAHFFEKVGWKRVVCVAATMPIAVMTNGLRIGVTGILTTFYGKEAAEGFFHDFEGWVMFVVSFIILCLLGRVLRLLSPNLPGNGPLPAVPVETPIAGGGQSGVAAFSVSIVLLLVVMGLSFSVSALPAMKIRGGIAGFPLTFGGWQGRSEIMDPQVVALSGAEESFSGHYGNGRAQTVSLYIGYRSTAFLENENFFHSPTVCLPSAGWEVVRTTRRRIANVPVFGELPVTEMFVENMGSRQLVYFWFQTKSRVTADKNINRFHLTLHALQRNNTYDLFLRPITPIAPGETTADAEARLDSFVREATGAMTTFLSERT